MEKNKNGTEIIIVVELATMNPVPYGNLTIAAQKNNFEVGLSTLYKKEFPIELQDHLIFKKRIIRSTRNEKKNV